MKATDAGPAFENQKVVGVVHPFGGEIIDAYDWWMMVMMDCKS